MNIREAKLLIAAEGGMAPGESLAEAVERVTALHRIEVAFGATQKLEAEAPSWEKEENDGRRNHEGTRSADEAAASSRAGIPVGGREGNSEVRGSDSVGALEVAGRAGGIESTRPEPSDLPTTEGEQP